MAWLNLNGYEIQVADESTTVEDDTPQEQWRSVNATAVSQYTSSKRRWSFETTVATEIETALSIERLLRPQDNGHVWDGHSLYSSKLMRTIGTAPAVTAMDPWGAPDGRLLDISGGYFNVAKVPETYTLMAWHFEGVWRHLTLRSDFAFWIDGVRNDGGSFSDYMSVDANGVWRIDGNGLNKYATDLVYYPFKVPDLWPEQYDRDRPHSDLPRLVASGDFWPEPVVVELSGTVSVRQVHTIEGVRGVVQFSLREV